MERQHRILLIDDDIAGAEIYASSIRAQNYCVDLAHTAETAIAALRDKIYDVAVVDLHLSGPAGDLSGGRAVLAAAQLLGEPVATIVLTSQKSAQLAADLVQDGSATRFVSKHTISEQGIRPLLIAIELALSQAKPLPHDFMKQMAGSEHEEIWVDTALRTLKPKDGYRGLARFLTEFLEAIAPVRSLSESATTPLHPSANGRALEGLFWSKRLGQPILLRLKSAGESDDAPPAPAKGTLADIVHRHSSVGIDGIAWSVNGYTRGVFVA